MHDLSIGGRGGACRGQDLAGNRVMVGKTLATACSCSRMATPTCSAGWNDRLKAWARLLSRDTGRYEEPHLDSLLEDPPSDGCAGNTQFVHG